MRSATGTTEKSNSGNSGGRGSFRVSLSTTSKLVHLPHVRQTWGSDQEHPSEPQLPVDVGRPWLREAVRRACTANERSVSAEAQLALKRHLEREPRSPRA
jgi:hypothetical protein